MTIQEELLETERSRNERLQAERDSFKELWDGTRETAERFRAALEYIASGAATSAAAYARQVLVAASSAAR